MTLNLTFRQARRSVLAGISITVLALAACPGGPRGPAAPTGIEPPPVPAGQQTNEVAVIVPLTGADGAVGTSIANAARLALLDTREATIRIQVYDSNRPGGAAAATQQAIADGSRLILGPLLAEDVRAAAPVARRAGIPVIAFSNDESVAGDGVYIMGFTPDQSISRTVAFARSKGANSFGGLVPTGHYGQRAAQALIGAVRKSGGRVASIESYDRGQAAINLAARRLTAKGPVDAVLIGDSSRMAVLAGPSLRLIPRKLGTELWASDRTIGKTLSLRGAWYSAAPDVQFDRLVTRYRARYGKTPYRLASLGYDAVLLAVRSAGNWPVGRAFPSRMLVEKDGFAGVDGSFRFARDGIAERLLEVRQVNATGTSVVSPAGTVF
jgi:ABC-type branched-subunit amino acid transport system substrate-binding protein